ncbi:MAG: IS1380 family transposase [Tepidiformaceae bacterium]
MNHTRARSRINVTSDGEGIVSHAGALLLAELADRIGLTADLSRAMAPTRRRRSAHDPGKVLVDIAVALADGADCLADLAVLRANADVFGPVASDPTAWRVVSSIGTVELDAVNAARARTRARAWGAGVRRGWIVLDLDATLVTSHSEKQDAAPTYKHGFGFHPVMCYLDGTGEALAGMLRAGNAGSNTAADHLAVVDQALAQLPVATRADDPHAGEWMLLRADSASATHAFVDGLRHRGIEFSIGFPLTEDVRQAVLSLPERAWTGSMDQTCGLREGAECAEVTHLLDLGSWPEGTRAICRREDPHPGAQLTFTDQDGHRFQVFITDSADPDLAYLEARHRGHARVEDRIRCAKDTGMANLPFHDFAANQAWLTLVLMAQDLLAWAQRLCLDGQLAKAEPKRLRYALWHVAGRLVTTGRRRILRLAKGWPWADELVQAFRRLQALAVPT